MDGNAGLSIGQTEICLQLLDGWIMEWITFVAKYCPTLAISKQFWKEVPANTLDRPLLYRMTKTYILTIFSDLLSLSFSISLSRKHCSHYLCVPHNGHPSVRWAVLLQDPVSPELEQISLTCYC